MATSNTLRAGPVAAASLIASGQRGKATSRAFAAVGSRGSSFSGRSIAQTDGAHIAALRAAIVTASAEVDALVTAVPHALQSLAAIPDVAALFPTPAVSAIASAGDPSIPQIAVALIRDVYGSISGGLPSLATDPVDSFSSWYFSMSEADQDYYFWVILAVSGYLGSTPGPISGLFDFYILQPLNKLVKKTYNPEDIILGANLGQGNFGTVYEAYNVGKNSGITSANQMDDVTRRKTRLIMKKTKNDGLGRGRKNFLAQGTIARGAFESGQAEMYMNYRLGRIPFSNVARYRGDFVVTDQAKVGSFLRGDQWLVWDYETNATLEDFVVSDFPYSIEPYIFGKELDLDEAIVTKKVIQRIMKQVFSGISSMHATGIVHRDVKPSNILVTSSGKVKFCDLGAATDLRTGINFSPDTGMLDPNYAPPEELVLPMSTPRPPFPWLASIGSPFLWFATRPDLFDTYSAGIVFMQMAVPEFRSPSGLAAFKRDLSNAGGDLKTWVDGDYATYKRADLSVLEANLGAGLNLAERLLSPRNAINRGRLSANQALRHPFFFS